MAVSANYSFNLDLEGLVRNGMRLAGLLGPGEAPTADDVSMGGEFLNLLLKGWQSAGRHLRQVERVTKALTAGTATVTVDADTIDIDFPAYVSPTTGSQTYAVERMTMDEYMLISNKTETGIPERALVERKSTVVMTLWPVPSSAVTSISYIRVRLKRDVDAGTNPDEHQRYLDAICWGLAWQFAESFNKSSPKIERLAASYQRAQGAMRGDNAERGPVSFRLR